MNLACKNDLEEKQNEGFIYYSLGISLCLETQWLAFSCIG